jgi:hypothetical protein
VSCVFVKLVNNVSLELGRKICRAGSQKLKFNANKYIPFLFSNFDLSVGYYVTFLSAATGK